jgi:hypothetical protein
MSQNFQPGDFLIFQLESGYGLLRILAIGERGGGPVWHLAAYNEFFLDVDAAEAAIDSIESLSISLPHAALTDRAFLSTQCARLKNVPLSDEELKPYQDWVKNGGGEISDRSIRLILGLR